MNSAEKSVTIVLLPGFDGTGNMFYPLINALGNAVETQVIAYPNNQVMDYSQLSQYVAQKLPKQAFFIVAESFAGPIAILLAHLQLTHLKGIVLCATFLRCPYPLLGKLSKGLVGAWMFRLPVSQWSVKFFLTQNYFSNDELQVMIHTHRELHPEILAARLRIIIELDVCEQFRTCKVPMMIINATRDRLIGRAPGKHMVKLRPDTPHCLITAPHFVLQTQPKTTSEKILDFVERHLRVTRVPV